MITEQYREAVRTLNAHGNGTVALKNGSEVSGALWDIQSKTNDPDGVGFMTFMQSNGKAVDVYQNEFAGLVEVW